MLKRELRSELRRCRKTNVVLQGAVDALTDAAVVVARAREVLYPPLGVRDFALALHEANHCDVGRFLRGVASQSARARIRPKVQAWLAPRIAGYFERAGRSTNHVLASLDDDAFRDLLFWSRAVARPPSRRP